jgi:hypothetical protein
LNSNLNTSAGVPPTILSPLPSRPQVQVFLEPLDIRDQLPFIFLAATVAIGGYSVPNTGMLKGFVKTLYYNFFVQRCSEQLDPFYIERGFPSEGEIGERESRRCCT